MVYAVEFACSATQTLYIGYLFRRKVYLYVCISQFLLHKRDRASRIGVGERDGDESLGRKFYTGL